MAAPRKYPPHGAAEIIKNLAIQGHSLTGIASELKVSRDLIKRWFEDDSSLEESFEQGKEFERKALDDLIKRDAAAGKPANANAMFLLKCRHRYREVDSPKTDVNVGVQVQSVFVVKDHGSDADWERKAAEQQRRLTANAAGEVMPAIDAKPAIAPPVTSGAPEAPAWMPLKRLT